jgi:hypothetical protein
MITAATGKVVGVFPLRSLEFIENILPHGHGYYLVFGNSHGQTFTYRLDGPYATYMDGVICMIPSTTIWV